MLSRESASRFYVTTNNATKIWPLEDVIDVNPRDIVGTYQQAYSCARKQDYQRAARYLIQLADNQDVSQTSIGLELSFEEVCDITAANPACASRLLADRRNFNKFNSLARVIDYLKLVPHTASLLFARQHILNLITGHITLAQVLQVSPSSVNLLLFEKKLAQKFIQYGSNLTEMALSIPNLMPEILQNPEMKSIACSSQVEEIFNLIISAPALIYLLKIPSVRSKTKHYGYEYLRLALEHKANIGQISAQKVLGFAYMEGMDGIFKKDELMALGYLEKASKHDVECGKYLSSFLLKEIEKKLADINPDLANILTLHGRMHKKTEPFRMASWLIAERMVAMGGWSNEKSKRKIFRLLIDAYRLNRRDDSVLNLLDHLLSQTDSNTSYLKSRRLELQDRLEYINKFEKEEAEEEAKRSSCLTPF